MPELEKRSKQSGVPGVTLLPATPRPEPAPTDLLSCPWYAAAVRAATVLADATGADGVCVRLTGADVPVPREFRRVGGDDLGDGVCTCVESPSYRLEVVLTRRTGRDPFGHHTAALLQHLRPAVQRGLDAARHAQAPRCEVQLSQAERRIAEGLRQELTEREIAQRLGRSANTVHVHVKSIYRKVGVRTRQQLIDRLNRQPRLIDRAPDGEP